MLTLHPQSAMEHLHHRFVAADGSGSDGAIAFEATEVASTARGADARPGPAGRAAGRRPGPLADPARGQRAGRRRRRGQRRGRQRADRPPAARSSALVARAQDLMPQPQAGLPPGDAAGVAARDAAPGGDRRPRARRRRRRARAGRLRVRRARSPQEAISSVNAGQQALDAAREDLAKVVGARASTSSRTIRTRRSSC